MRKGRYEGYALSDEARALVKSFLEDAAPLDRRADGPDSLALRHAPILHSFVWSPGVHALLCGILPDPGPASASQVVALIFAPKARARIHGVCALARFGTDRIRRRARLSTRHGAGLFLSHGTQPATVLPLLEDATEAEIHRLLLRGRRDPDGAPFPGARLSPERFGSRMIRRCALPSPRSSHPWSC